MRYRRMQRYPKPGRGHCTSFYSICGHKQRKDRESGSILYSMPARWNQQRGGFCEGVNSFVPGINKPSFRRLKRDDLGVAIFPLIQATRAPTEKSQTEQWKKMVRYSHLYISFYISNLKSRILI